MIKKNQKGLSIVETVVSLSVFSIVMAVSGQLLMSTQKMSSMVNSQKELREENRKIDSLLTNELRKAIYFYPQDNGTTDIIPKAVKDNTNAIRVFNPSDNFPRLASNISSSPINGVFSSTTIGNTLTFISMDKTLKVSEVPFLQNYVNKLNLYNVTIDTLLSLLITNTTGVAGLLNGFSIVDQMAKDTKVQLVTLNNLFLRKNKETNNIDLVLYQQKGFFNDSPAMHSNMFNSEIKVSGALLGQTIDQTKDIVKSKIISQIQYYLNSKNYTGLQLPSDPFKNINGSSGGFVPPSLDFTNGGTNLNWANNSSYKVVASNIGIRIGNSSISYLGTQPTISNDSRTEFKSNINFKNANSSNTSLINTLAPSDIGFRVSFEKRDEILSVKLSLDLVKLSNDKKKAFYNHTEFNIKPKILG